MLVKYRHAMIDPIKPSPVAASNAVTDGHGLDRDALQLAGSLHPAAIIKVDKLQTFAKPSYHVRR